MHQLSSPAWRSHWRGKMSARPLAAVADRWGKKKLMTEFVTATDGIRIAYERAGEGPPVVLVHGFGSSKEQN